MSEQSPGNAAVLNSGQPDSKFYLELRSILTREKKFRMNEIGDTNLYQNPSLMTFFKKYRTLITGIFLA